MLITNSTELLDVRGQTSVTLREKRSDASPFARVDWRNNLTLTLFPPPDSDKEPKMALRIAIHCDPHPRCCLIWETLGNGEQPPIGFVSLLQTEALTFLRNSDAVGMLAVNGPNLLGIARNELPGRSVLRKTEASPLFLDFGALHSIAAPETFNEPGVIDHAAGAEILDESDRPMSDLAQGPLIFESEDAGAVLGVRTSGEIFAHAPGLIAVRDGNGARVYVLRPQPKNQPPAWCSFLCTDGDSRRLKIFGDDFTKRAEVSLADEGMLLTSVSGVMKALQ